MPYLSSLFLEHAQPCSLGFISVFIVPCSLGSKSLRRRIPVSFLPKETQQLEQPHTVLGSSFVERALKTIVKHAKAPSAKL